jgi:hypothetical protein
MGIAIESEDWRKASTAVNAYGKARKRFREAQRQLPKLLGGNDNKVGVCGEFWAKWFYHKQGYAITEVPHSNNPGYDFRCSKGRTSVRVSVKVVSDESSTGRQSAMRLKEAPAEWDRIALVLLSEEMQAYRIGVATRRQFERARAEGAMGSKPCASRSWVKPKGWMAKYGKVDDPRSS